MNYEESFRMSEENCISVIASWRKNTPIYIYVK